MIDPESPDKVKRFGDTLRSILNVVCVAMGMIAFSLGILLASARQQSPQDRGDAPDSHGRSFTNPPVAPPFRG